MKTNFIITSVFFLILGSFSCCEEPEKVLGPCEGTLWGKATIDGRDVCFENIRIVYQNANTANAYIQLTMFNQLRNTGESIDAFFRVPIDGLAINTAYPAYDGKYFNTEDVLNGSFTYSYYNSASTVDAERYSQGTFKLSTENPNNSAAQSTITGEFIYKF